MRFLTILLLVILTYLSGCTNITNPEVDFVTDLGISLVTNDHSVDAELIDQLFLDMAECSGFDSKEYISDLIVMISDDLPDNIAGRYVYSSPPDQPHFILLNPKHVTALPHEIGHFMTRKLSSNPALMGSHNPCSLTRNCGDTVRWAFDNGTRYEANWEPKPWNKCKIDPITGWSHKVENGDPEIGKGIEYAIPQNIKVSHQNQVKTIAMITYEEIGKQLSKEAVRKIFSIDLSHLKDKQIVHETLHLIAYYHLNKPDGDEDHENDFFWTSKTGIETRALERLHLYKQNKIVV